MDIELELYNKFEYAASLGKHHDDGIVIDDTQVGLEFAMKFYKPYVDRAIAAESTIAELQGRLSAAERNVFEADQDCNAANKRAGAHEENYRLANREIEKLKAENDQLPAQLAEQPKQDAVNQCDGCQAGIPVVDGFHHMADRAIMHDRMRCEKDKYESQEQPKPAESFSDEIIKSFSLMTSLVRLKYGNLDEDIYAEIEKTEALIKLISVTSPKVEQVSGGDEAEMFLIATGDYHKGHATYTGHFKRPENFDENNLLHNRIWFEPKPSPNKADVWQSIETAPKDRRVLLGREGHDHTYVGKWSEHEKAWQVGSADFYHKPSHWKEAPPPPLKDED